MRYVRLFLLIVLLPAGCGRMPHTTFDLTVINRTDNPINEVRFVSASFQFEFGYLSSGAAATFANAPYPVPRRAQLTWKSGSRAGHQNVVQMSPPIAPEYAGELILSIEKDDRVVLSSKVYDAGAVARP